MEDQGLYLTSFQQKLLLKRIQSDLRSEYRRRIEIMLRADAGETQSQICAELQCSHETARYWISMARSGKAHLWDENPIGRPKTVDDDYLDRLRDLVSRSPREYGYPFKRWTGQWLQKHLAKELGVEVSARHINRLLKKMGLSTHPKTNPDVTNVTSENSTIAIHDLNSSSSPNSVWALNLLRAGN